MKFTPHVQQCKTYNVKMIDNLHESQAKFNNAFACKVLSNQQISIQDVIQNVDSYIMVSKSAFERRGNFTRYFDIKMKPTNM